MKVLLISANTERLNMPTLPLGLGFVAAATRAAGHRVRFLDLMQIAEPTAALQKAIEEHDPDVIGISVRNIDDQDQRSPTFLLEKVRAVVQTCRDHSEALIVVGGAGYSIFPDAALSYLGADIGVHGDGEVTFPSLLERLDRGEDPSDLPGVHLARSGTGRAVAFPDLAPLPLPDDAFCASISPDAPDLWIPVQTRRGCPNGCCYCSTSNIQGRKIRSRPAGEMVEHVARLSRQGFGRFYFVDNAFNMPESYALEVCDHLAKLDPPVTWRCILYPHAVSDELLAAMARSGCVEVALGFESGDEEVLRQLNKHFTPAEILDLSNRLAASSIRRMGFLLLGGPGETRESVERSLAFARQLAPELLRITVGIRIYPDTPLAKRALEEGVIGPDDDLLRPHFYLAPGLDPWIYERVTTGVVRSLE